MYAAVVTKTDESPPAMAGGCLAAGGWCVVGERCVGGTWIGPAAATLSLDVPVINEGTITIGAGRTVVVAESASGGVWGGEGTLNVSGGELVVASDATVALAGALTRLSGSLSGAGSFGVW